jgi:hypothetical protein
MSTLVGKLKKYVAIVILAAAIVWMLTPIPEGSIILSVILAYFGYKLTLDFQTSVLIFIITFMLTLTIFSKLKLLEKLRTSLKKYKSE